MKFDPKNVQVGIDNKWINPIDGATHIIMGSDKEIEYKKQILNRRHEIAVSHGKKNGWPDDINKWTLDQVLSLHDLEEWRKPFLNEGKS